MKNKFVFDSRLKKYLFLSFYLSLFLSLVFVILFYIRLGDALIFDFISLKTGAEIIRNGEGRELYNLDTQRAFQQEILTPFGIEIGDRYNLLPYLNFPLLALFFVPFTILDFYSAFKFYVLILVFVLFSIAFLSAKIMKGINSDSIWIFLPFLYYPSIGAALIGQTSILLTLLVLLIYWKLKQKNYIAGGILSGLLLLKIQYIILVPFALLAIKKRRDYIRGIICSAIVIITVSYLLSGPFWNDYTKLLAVAQNPEFGLSDSKLFTLYGSMKQIKFFENLNFWNLFAVNGALYSLFIIFYSKYKNKLTIDLNYSAAILTAMAFCIHGVDYDQSLLLVPIYLLLNNIKTNKKTNITEIIALFALILTPVLLLLDKGVYTSFILISIAVFLLVKTVPEKKQILP